MKKIFVAGHKGMVGSAICRRLQNEPNVEIITRTREELDLLIQAEVYKFLKTEKPDEVILAAARVGGIYANQTYPAEFIFQNMEIQNNLIHGSFLGGVEKLLFLGSSCIYPKYAQQPITESSLLTGALENTNEPYAIAKIAGLKMCDCYNRQFGTDYRAVMPTNLYGIGDNFHPENSHVLPALIRRFHEACRANESVVHVWGSGKPKREFLNVADMADASIHILNLEKSIWDEVRTSELVHVNVGSGEDITINQLSQLVAKIVGYHGEIRFDRSKPDGTPRKLLDVTLINKLGWRAQIDLETGIKETYDWFLENSVRSN